MYTSGVHVGRGSRRVSVYVGANLVIGTIDNLENIVEYRVEMVCKVEKMIDVLEVMEASHPYEEVAYGVVKILTLESRELLLSHFS